MHFYFPWVYQEITPNVCFPGPWTCFLWFCWLGFRQGIYILNLVYCMRWSSSLSLLGLPLKFDLILCCTCLLLHAASCTGWEAQRATGSTSTKIAGMWMVLMECSGVVLPIPTYSNEQLKMWDVHLVAMHINIHNWSTLLRIICLLTQTFRFNLANTSAASTFTQVSIRFCWYRR